MRRHMGRRNKLDASMLLAVCSCMAIAVAQSPSRSEPGSLTGIVSNSVTGNPVVRAHVTLQSYPNVYGAMTTVDGRFSITTIVPGSYSLLVERRGYSSFTVSGLASGQNLEVRAGD